MSITIINNNEITESTIISSKIETSFPQTAEQKDAENYEPNEKTQPETAKISYDEAAEQQAQDDEEAVANSLEFQKQFVAALENVKYIAKCDREAILEKIKQENIDEIGEEEAEEQIAEAFEAFAIEEAEVSVSEESEYDSCDETVPEEEYLQAIEHIRELGAIHQETFAIEICETYSNLNGKEITSEELRNIFDRIRKNFADEAREEFMELNDNESDSDSDYDENNETDLEQFEIDNFINTKQKIEIVYVDNSSDSEFFSSESESEIDSENVSDSEGSNDYSDSEQESEDYLPEQDGFDYSQDIEDEKTFKQQLNGTDENEVTCDESENESNVEE